MFYVTDSVTNGVSSISTSNGLVVPLFTLARGSPSMIRMNRASGNLFIVDNANASVYVYTIAGVFVTSYGYFGFTGYFNGNTYNLFSYPRGLGADFNGSMLVTDAGNAVVRKITGLVTSTVAGTFGEGSSNGLPFYSKFSSSMNGICIAPDDTIYVSETFGIRRIVP